MDSGCTVIHDRISASTEPAARLYPMTDRDDMDAIREQLEGAGLMEAYVDADGRQAMRLTDDGKRLARQMTMSDDPDAVLDALLEAQSDA